MIFFGRMVAMILKNDQWGRSQAFTKLTVGTDPKYKIDLSWYCAYELLCRVVPMVKKNQLWD